MARHILTHLISDLESACKLTETFVLRTKAGEVYSVELGESLLSSSLPYEARVNRLSPKAKHVGVCQGSTLDQVFNTAQNLVARAVDDHGAELAAAMPKPHRQPMAAL